MPVCRAPASLFEGVLAQGECALISALAGRAVRYEAPRHTGEDLVASEGEENYRPSAAPATTASIAEGEDEEAPPQPVKKQQKKKEAAVKRKKADMTTTS